LMAFKLRISDYGLARPLPRHTAPASRQFAALSLLA
jgi:hypothetical protein